MSSMALWMCYTYRLPICWSNRMACRWLKVPRSLSCPLRRTPVMEKSKTDKLSLRPASDVNMLKIAFEGLSGLLHIRNVS